MRLSHQEMPGDAQDDLFPFAWLTTVPIQTLINAAPTGVALLQAVHDESSQIIDFQYQLVNPMQQALTNYPEEDLLRLPLTMLSPDVAETGMLSQLIQVVRSGQPSLQVTKYRLDGDAGLYNQLYLKSGNGVLMLVQDITYHPLSASEQRQQAALLDAVQRKEPIDSVRAKLIALISGQAQ